VTPASITAGYWEYVDSGTSSAAALPGAPITFQLMLGRYYHLVETTPPPAPVAGHPGYQLPWGQWRVMAFSRVVDVSGTPTLQTGFSITAQGDPSIPAFVNPTTAGVQQYITVAGAEHRIQWGGLNYVGNRQVFVLPLTGLTPFQLVTVLGFLTIGLAIGGGIFYAKRAKLGPWKADDDLIADLPDSCDD